MDTREVSSIFVSSLSERSYGPGKPGKTANKATASHDSSDEIVGKSSHGSVKQRHARLAAPELKKRKESLPLLALSDQAQKRSNSSVPQKSRSSNADRQAQGRTSASPAITVATPPSVVPRSSSLQSKPANHSGVHPSNALEGANASTPTLKPKKHDGMSAASTTKDESWVSMHASIRKMALAKDTSMDAIKKIEELYRADRYRKMPDKTGLTLGNITPISMNETSGKQNGDYFWRVLELYKLNVSNEVFKRMDDMVKTVVAFEREDHKFLAGRDMLELMMWRLTPSQRNLLRRDFPLLYWDATIRDDINWLFFDTIISSAAKTHIEQKKIMQMIVDTPVEKRQEVRDKIMDKAHGKMSIEQRNELKKICKSRHDELMNSRLPTLHVLIRQKNEKAMMAYIDTVLRYAPRTERVRLLEARGDNQNGVGKGDASFFTLAHSGSAEMMGAYLERILRTKKLSIGQKWSILSASRSDWTSAFHMMMCAGDWTRVELFLLEIYRFKAGRPNCREIGAGMPRGLVKTHARDKPKFITMSSMMDALLRADISDHRRRSGVRSAYNGAIDNGKKECAKKFKKLAMHKDIVRYFSEAQIGWMTNLRPIDNSRPTFAEKAAVNAHLRAEKPLIAFRKSLTTEALPPEKRDEALRDAENLKKDQEERRRQRLEEFPELETITAAENAMVHNERTAIFTYPHMDARTERINIKRWREEKRRESWPFSRKSTHDPAMSNSPTSSNASELFKMKKIRRVYQSGTAVTSMTSLTEHHSLVPLPIIRHSPNKATPNTPPKSPSSPYKGDQQPLIDASEGA